MHDNHVEAEAQEENGSENHLEKQKRGKDKNISNEKRFKEYHVGQLNDLKYMNSYIWYRWEEKILLILPRRRQ